MQKKDQAFDRAVEILTDYVRSYEMYCLTGEEAWDLKRKKSFDDALVFLGAHAPGVIHELVDAGMADPRLDENWPVNQRRVAIEQTRKKHERECG